MARTMPTSMAPIDAYVCDGRRPCYLTVAPGSLFPVPLEPPTSEQSYLSHSSLNLHADGYAEGEGLCYIAFTTPR